MDELLLAERKGEVLRLTLNRPQAHNALNRDLARALRDCFDGASDDEGLRVIVLTAAGERTFCAGADLKDGDGKMFDAGDGANPIGDVMRAMRGCRKLVVARVNGSALAGGLGLISACDLVYAADHARFGIPEVRVGLFPLVATTLLLRQMPRRRLLELAYLGETMSAEEAARHGVINRAVAAGELDAVVDGVIDALARNAPGALAAGKRAINALEDLTAPQAIAHAELLLARLSVGDEAREGRAAFAEKRRPSWMPSQPL